DGSEATEAPPTLASIDPFMGMSRDLGSFIGGMPLPLAVEPPAEAVPGEEPEIEAVAPPEETPPVAEVVASEPTVTRPETVEEPATVEASVKEPAPIDIEAPEEETLTFPEDLEPLPDVLK